MKLVSWSLFNSWNNLKNEMSNVKKLVSQCEKFSQVWRHAPEEMCFQKMLSSLQISLTIFMLDITHELEHHNNKTLGIETTYAMI